MHGNSVDLTIQLPEGANAKEVNLPPCLPNVVMTSLLCNCCAVSHRDSQGGIASDPTSEKAFVCLLRADV